MFFQIIFNFDRPRLLLFRCNRLILQQLYYCWWSKETKAIILLLIPILKLYIIDMTSRNLLLHLFFNGQFAREVLLNDNVCCSLFGWLFLMSINDWCCVVLTRYNSDYVQNWFQYWASTEAFKNLFCNKMGPRVGIRTT